MEEFVDADSLSVQSSDAVWASILSPALRAATAQRPGRDRRPLSRPLVVTSVDCDSHRVPHDHPESHLRLMCIRACLHKHLNDGEDAVDWLYVHGVSPNFLPALVHSRQYLDVLGTTFRRVQSQLTDATQTLLIDAAGRNDTGDTFVSRGTASAISASSAAIRTALNAVLRGDRFTAAVLIRPPGHHCSHLMRINEAQMGFCVVNTAMQAVRYAQAQHALLPPFLRGALTAALEKRPSAGPRGSEPCSDAPEPAARGGGGEPSSRTSVPSAAVGDQGQVGQGQWGGTPSLIEALALGTGLRIAIVDIDAHTGNGTQDLILATAQHLGLAEHVWTYDPAAPPVRTSRSKRILSLHHKGQRRTLELPRGPSAQLETPALTTASLPSAALTPPAPVLDPSAALTLTSPAVRAVTAPQSAVAAAACTLLQHPDAALASAQDVNSSTSAQSNTEAAPRRAAVNSRASSALAALFGPLRRAQPTGGVAGGPPTSGSPANHADSGASLPSLGDSIPHVSTPASAQAALRPRVVDTASISSSSSSSSASDIGTNPRGLDAREGKRARFDEALPGTSSKGAASRSVAVLTSARGKRHIRGGGKPTGRLPVMRVRQADPEAPAPVGSADDTRNSESVMAEGAPGSCVRVVEPSAPNRRHRAGVSGPIFPPVCWRSNRLFYRHSRIAGAHAHDVGHDANGWVPAAWSGRRTGLPGSPEPRVALPSTTLTSGLVPVVSHLEPVALLTPAPGTSALLASTTKRENEASMIDSAMAVAPPALVPFPINGSSSVAVAALHELDARRGLPPALQAAAESSAAGDVLAVVNGTGGGKPDEDCCAGMKRPREVNDTSGVRDATEASINRQKRDVPLASAGPVGVSSESGCYGSIAGQPGSRECMVDGALGLPLERAERGIGGTSSCEAPCACDPQAGRRPRAGAPAVDLLHLGAPPAARAASSSPGPQPTHSAVPQQVLFVSIHQYHPVLYPGYELAHDGISSGDAVARVFTRPPWAPSPAGWESRSSAAVPVGGRIVAKAVGSNARGLSSYMAPGASAMLSAPGTASNTVSDVPSDKPRVDELLSTAAIARPGSSSSVPQLQGGGAHAVPSLPASSAQARTHVAGPTLAASTHSGASALKPRAVARVLRQRRASACRRFEAHYWTESSGKLQPRFPLAVLRPPNRQVDWLADISLPIDVSLVGSDGEERSGDGISSDEDSGDDDEELGTAESLPGRGTTVQQPHGSPPASPGLACASQFQRQTRSSDPTCEAESPPSSARRFDSRVNPGTRIWRAEVESTLLPALRVFAPDLIIVSAGFDAHTSDPLGHLHLQTADYSWIAEQLVSVCPRVVSILEGGYGVDTQLAESVKAHVEGLSRGTRRRVARMQSATIPAMPVTTGAATSVAPAQGGGLTAARSCDPAPSPLAPRPTAAPASLPKAVAALRPLPHGGGGKFAAIAGTTAALPIPFLGHVRRLLDQTGCRQLADVACDGVIDHAILRALRDSHPAAASARGV